MTKNKHKSKQKASHTPGPWEYLPSVSLGIRHFFTVAKKTGGFSPAYIDIHETEAYLGDADLAEKEANARLIAASPKLLAACRMVVERWERGDLAEAARACQEAIDEATTMFGRAA